MIWSTGTSCTPQGMKDYMLEGKWAGSTLFHPEVGDDEPKTAYTTMVAHCQIFWWIPSELRSIIKVVSCALVENWTIRAPAMRTGHPPSWSASSPKDQIRRGQMQNTLYMTMVKGSSHSNINMEWNPLYSKGLPRENKFWELTFLCASQTTKAPCRANSWDVTVWFEWCRVQYY